MSSHRLRNLQQWLRRSLIPWCLHPIGHHPGLQEPAYQPQDICVLYLPGYTLHRPVQVLGFDEFGHLTPVQRLTSASCTAGQRFAVGLASDAQSPAEPLPLATSSPCRASRGFSPPSKCALPGAPKKIPPEGRD